MSQPSELFGGKARHTKATDPKNARMTPEWVLALVRIAHSGQIELDPATEPNNPTNAKKFFTAEDDGLKQKWGKKKVFLNPPYGNDVSLFIEKAYEEAAKGAKIIMLLACRPSSKWQQKLWAQADDILLLNERVKFANRDGVCEGSPAFDSMLVALNCSLEKIAFRGTRVKSIGQAA